MKSLPAPYAAEKNRKRGAAPVWILKCPFSSGTLYLSDRTFVVPGWDGGVTTKSWIKEWGELDEDLSGELSAPRVADFTVEILVDRNSSPNIEGLLWSKAQKIESVPCTLYQWFLGLDAAAAPPQKFQVFYVVDYPPVDELLYRVRFVDQSVWYDRHLSSKIDLAAYPNAHLDDVGKVEPILYGAGVTIPALRTDWGHKTTLKAGISAAETGSLDLSEDDSRMPSSGSVWIDGEQIGYAGKSGRVLSTLTRNQNGAGATLHNAGAVVWQHKTQYDSLLSRYELQSVGDIFAEIEGQLLRVTSGVSAVLSGGKHYLRATAQIRVQPIGDGIGVNDGIGVSDNIGVSASASTKTVYPTSGGNAADGNEDTYEADLGSGSPYVTVTFPSTSYGTVSAQYYWLVYSTQFASGTNGARYRVAGGSWVGLDGTGGVTTKRKVRVAVSGGSWGDALEFDLLNGTEARLWECYKEVDYTPTLTKSGSAYRSGSVTKTGGLVLTQVVERFHATVNGCKDDASGTYTGTPNALIEYPDHVFKHLLNKEVGFPVADVYTNATALFVSKAYKFAGIINEYRKLKEWTALLAFQCRCYFRFHAGQAQLLWIYDFQVPAKNIPDSMIRQDATGRLLLKKRPAPLQEIINKIDIRYDRDWRLSGDTAYRASSVHKDDTSIGDYGVKERPELFLFDFVRAAAVAADVGALYLARHKDRKPYWDVEGFLDNSELEFADYVSLSSHGVLVEIRTVNMRPGSGVADRNDHIFFMAREYGPFEFGEVSVAATIDGWFAFEAFGLISVAASPSGSVLQHYVPVQAAVGAAAESTGYISGMGWGGVWGTNWGNA